jgi:hypothetical protein
MDIVNLFYELARQDKTARAFVYGKAYEKGSGNDLYPLVWLDDPILGNAFAAAEPGRVIQYTANVDFLGIPVNDSEVLSVQSAAFEMGLAYFDKIKQTRPVTGFGGAGFAFVSLRDYYDDKAAGFRFTFTLNQANPIDRCKEFFDPAKTFPGISTLPDFATENPDGCAVFSDSNTLPNFKTS